MITNKILVEAAGVELFTTLTARKLLISRTATTAKKAPLPDPLYVYCTKMLSLLSPADPHSDHSIPWIRRAGSKKTPSFLRYVPPPCHFLATPAPNFRVARYPGGKVRGREISVAHLKMTAVDTPLTSSDCARQVRVKASSLSHEEA